MKIWDELISLKEAANILNKEESTLRKAIARGVFIENKDCKKFGATWVFKRNSLSKLKNKK